jgi:hypothetical protein
MISQISCPLVKKTLSSHSLIKQVLLDAIEASGAEFKSPNSAISRENYAYITKSDYYSKVNGNVPYKELAVQLEPILLELCSTFNWERYQIHNVWFQQYEQGSSHGYHTHTHCQFTGVYYLELPDIAPRTEMINPFDSTPTVINVSEGDVIIFPSFIRHRAPVVQSDIRKTIISFNLSFE